MPQVKPRVAAAAEVSIGLARLRAAAAAFEATGPDELLFDDAVDAALAPHVALPSAGPPPGAAGAAITEGLALTGVEAADAARAPRRRLDELSKLRQAHGIGGDAPTATGGVGFATEFPPCSIDAAPSEPFRVYEKRLTYVRRHAERWKRERGTEADRCADELAATQKRRAAFSRQRAGGVSETGQTYISEGNRAFNRRLATERRKQGGD